MEQNATGKQETVVSVSPERARVRSREEAPAPPGNALSRLQRFRIGALQTLCRLIAERRWASMLYSVAWYLPDWLFRFNRASLMVTPVRELPHRRNANYRSSLAEIPDMEEVGTIIGYPAAELVRRLDDGGCCLITRDIVNANRIINVQWFHRGDCYVRGLGLRVQIGNNSGYTYGSFTIPEYRMRGVFQTALNDVVGLLRDEGVRQVFCLIESYNALSHRVHLRLGYKVAADIRHAAVLGVKFTHVRHCTTGQCRMSLFLRHPGDVYLI